MATIIVLPTIGKTKKGFRVRFREDGKLRAEEFGTKDEARRRHSELKKLSSASAPPPVEVKGDGTSAGDWLALLWELAKRVMAGDISAQRQLSVMATAARSVNSLFDMEKIKRGQEEVKAMVREIRAHRKHGTRVSAGTGTPQVDAPTREPIH